MSYCLQKDEVLTNGVRRIALEEIDSALAYLHAPEHDLVVAVHESRKCFKKLRGLLRLVRKELGESVYQQENICFRDAGRCLSDLRDSAVRIQTLDNLTDSHDLPLGAPSVGAMREALVIFYRATRQRVVEEQQGLVRAAELIQAARHRVADWPLKDDSFSGVSGGLRQVYRRGRSRLNDVVPEPSVENFHEWRKQVKYLWYNVQILQPVWPNLMARLAEEIHDLSEILGDAHDLAMLQRLVEERPLILDNPDARNSFISFLETESQNLHAAAYRHGRRIYAEAPKPFVKRLHAYWRISLA